MSIVQNLKSNLLLERCKRRIDNLLFQRLTVSDLDMQSRSLKNITGSVSTTIVTDVIPISTTIVTSDTSVTPLDFFFYKSRKPQY